MTDSNGTTAPTQSAGLTVDEMLAIYPRVYVKDAIYDRNYEAGRNRSLQRFRDLIAQGINVESCTKGMQEVLETTPSSPPVDPDESNDLDPDVLWRIKMLKFAYREGCYRDSYQLVNLNAVLDAYRRRDLKVVHNEATVWFAGKLVMGPLPNSELKIADYVDKVPAWLEKYGDGRVWVERPTRDHIQKLNSTVIPPSNEHQHHVFSIRARLIGATSFVVIHNILDDTGSDILEMYLDDCSALGLTPDYPYWEPDIICDTSNGQVRRSSFLLAAQLLSANGEPFGPVVLAEAVLIPNAGGNAKRTSGMFFREQLFTGTSPYGNGNLYLSDRKTGVTKLLPSS